MSNQERPHLLNRICAYPVIITCILSACVSNAIVIDSLGASLQTIASDWRWMLYFLFLVIPAASLLGCILGVMFIGQLVAFVCRKINGAPLKPGDQVMILCGSRKRTIAEVYEITVGREGWEVARLDLGPEYREHFRDTFDEWALLRIKRREQNGVVNRSQPDEND